MSTSFATATNVKDSHEIILSLKQMIESLEANPPTNLLALISDNLKQEPSINGGASFSHRYLGRSIVIDIDGGKGWVPVIRSYEKK